MLLGLVQIESKDNVISNLYLTDEAITNTRILPAPIKTVRTVNEWKAGCNQVLQELCLGRTIQSKCDNYSSSTSSQWMVSLATSLVINQIHAKLNGMQSTSSPQKLNSCVSQFIKLFVFKDLKI